MMIKIKLLFMLIYASVLGIIVCCLADEFNWFGLLACVMLLIVVIIKLRRMFKLIDRVNSRLRNKGMNNPLN